MGKIAEWLKQVIVMVILAGFFEILLPDNQLKNVTKMILGLIIIMLLIQPLMNLFHLPSTLAWSLPQIMEDNQVSQITDQVIREGMDMRRQWQVQFGNSNEKRLEQNLQKIFSMLEVKLEKVNCEYDGSRLNRVRLMVKPVSGDIIRSNSLQMLNKKLVQSVQLFTGLNEDQVEVRWNENNE